MADEDFPELFPWLQDNGLAEYFQAVSSWCEAEGAKFVDEIKDCWQDLADSLGLSGSARQLLADACGAHVVCSADAQYDLLEELGRGATATVYRCKHGSTHYATKVVDLQGLRKYPDAQLRMDVLLREMNILRSLRHDKVVCLHDVIETEYKLHLVMELIEGGDLFHHITSQPEKRLDESEARHIFAQVATALEYIHSRDIVHRDLKAENILVCRGSEVKITDFGHSKAIRDGYTRAESRVGTPVFWAPEVAQSVSGLSGYDERADLWSLGVVLYFMLEGMYPFDAMAPRTEEWIQRHLTFHGKRGPEELIRGLIRTKPGDRMSLKQCFSSSWLANALPTPCAPIEEGAKSSPYPGPESTDEANACVNQQEICIRLPRKPIKPSKFTAELHDFARKQKVSAKLKILDVMLTFSRRMSAVEVQTVREKLLQLLAKEFPELSKQAATGNTDGKSANARAQELKELEDTYGTNLEILSELQWRVRLGRDDALRVILQEGYPCSCSHPPAPVVECASELHSWFSEEELTNLWTPGYPCVYDWVERLKDAIAAPKLPPIQVQKKRPSSQDLGSAEVG